LLLLTFKTYYNHVTSKKREVTFMDTFQNEKSPVKVTLYKGKFLICGAAGNWIYLQDAVPYWITPFWNIM